jgi:hypothetical protein
VVALGRKYGVPTPAGMMISLNVNDQWNMLQAGQSAENLWAYHYD